MNGLKQFGEEVLLRMVRLRTSFGRRAVVFSERA